ncbi:MAG: NYN domain-containing protein [Thalassovita sp.]
MFYKDERIFVLIDGFEAMKSSRGLGFDIDYSKLRKAFMTRGRLVAIQYFASTVAGEGENPQIRKFDWMSYNGFRVTTREVREEADRYERSMDMDVGLGLVEASHVADHIVLFSSTERLAPMVDYVKRQGKRVTLVSSVKSEGSRASDKLRRAADQFVELAGLAEEIGFDRERCQATDMNR